MTQNKAALLLRVAFALTFSLILIQFKLDFLESYLQDLRFRLRPATGTSEKIELVLIDQKTVEYFSRIPSFKDHLAILKTIQATQPGALVYVTPLAVSEGAETDTGQNLSVPIGSPTEAHEFAQEIAKVSNFFQITDQMALKGEKSLVSLSAPFQKVPLLSAPKTADVNLFAKDGVTRRVMIDYLGEPLGHMLLAQKFNHELQDLGKVQGRFEVYETQQVLIDYRRTGSFSVTKFEDLAQGKANPEKFRGKLVLVGDDLGKSLRRYVLTPFSRDPSAMTLVEMHANMLDTFIRNSAPRKAADWVNLLLTGLISIFTLHVVLTLRPLKGMGLLLGAALILTFAGVLLFWPFGILIPMAHPYLAIFLCYYFFIPYRLIIENRRSWEYQQKNKLLSQVEELKTNFISMMSHDLKTPIARIQGMADVIMRDNSPISSVQREALDHIRASSDDLLRFINSILNYAPIESQGVQLRLQSRDVNQILDEVLRKYEFLAQLKHIELKSELEPLFPIQVDPDLMRQVFSNLVENAIKYSPENSKILITSEEANGHIRVQVADQGKGIPTEDQLHIFMKFFRSSKAKSSPIKGSGLGLYLARYFVELHKGQISVDSTEGEGSTFTVDLPYSR